MRSCPRGPGLVVCGGPWRSRACAFSLHLDLGQGALKVPKEADEGGRATSGSARKGKRQHSSPQNTLLDCSLCGKVFSSASSLSKHYLTHSQERKHVCKICSKAFKRQDHLCVGAGSGRLPRGLGARLGLSTPTISPHPPCRGPQGCAACAHMQCRGRWRAWASAPLPSACTRPVEASRGVQPVLACSVGAGGVPGPQHPSHQPAPALSRPPGVCNLCSDADWFP